MNRFLNLYSKIDSSGVLKLLRRSSVYVLNQSGNLCISSLRSLLKRPKPLRFIRRNKYKVTVLTLLFGLWYYFCLPEKLFHDPVSTVIVDKHGDLLGARVATDGQWRFPASASVPDKFAKAIICFEDKRFRQHIGVDFLALSRAAFTNISRNDIVSGASTISMQVVRLSRKNPPRTYLEKIREIIMATRLELRYDKEQILRYYASNAPFGGNVVGIDAAAWKYFGRSAEKLSWAEAATLAVLPNSPGLIHPGRNREQLKKKRDYLLAELYDQGQIDSVTYQLSILENLPEKPVILPDITPHLTAKIHAESRNETKSVFKTTIDKHIQLRASDIINRHSCRLSENKVENAAALIVEVETGNVVAYVGNSQHRNNSTPHVDLIQAPRSTGSILKPFLYAFMLQEGNILPETIIPDVPTFYGSYSPKNFYPKYDGAVPANKALARSLNIPAVRMLSDYGLPKFHHNLKSIGMTTLNKPASHYGLSLILGGAETNLWDLSRAYSGMARNLAGFRKNNGAYPADAFHDLYLFETQRSAQLSHESILEAPAIWHTFEAMLEVVRPEDELNWQILSSKEKVAWKTGTSFGFRDAWAVGCTPKYVVAVWVGNANGEGRPGLTGTRAAAPILFEIFDAIQTDGQWFEEPHHQMKKVEVCGHSGYLAGTHCSEKHSELIPANGLKSEVCPYCQTQFLHPEEDLLVTSECVSPIDMRRQSYFTLPSVMEKYYRKKHPEYIPVPPMCAECGESGKSFQVLYPPNKSRIYVPVNLDGTSSSTVFEITHRDPTTEVHWHLDEEYVGSTREFHEIAMNPSPGKHILTIVDEKGQSLQREFEIISDQKSEL